MRSNHTGTRSYLLVPTNLKGTLGLIEKARSETWRNGWDTTTLEKEYKKVSAEYRNAVDGIKTRISRIDGIDGKRMQTLLKLRYLQFKSLPEIERLTGWSGKLIQNEHERALMNMEIILVEDGILSFVDPKADMMHEYEDGYKSGLSEGKAEGYERGYQLGYGEGYERGEKGMPYDYCEDNEDDDDYTDAEEDKDWDWFEHGEIDLEELEAQRFDKIIEEAYRTSSKEV